MTTHMHETHHHGIMASSQTSSLLKLAVASCLACEEACTNCADACGSGDGSRDLDGTRRLARDCAASCRALGRALSDRNDEVVLTQISDCARSCALCGAECQTKARLNGHFQRAAGACSTCEEACRALLRRWHLEQGMASARP